MLLKKLLLYTFVFAYVVSLEHPILAVDARCQKIWAPTEVVKSSRNVGLSHLDKIRLASFNVGSLFQGEFDGQVIPSELSQSVVSRAFTLVENIEASGADVILLQEVESSEALSFFAKTFMSDSYKAFVFPSMEGFGKHIAILMKKTLNLRVEFESHLHQVWKDPVRDQKDPNSRSVLFKRDLPLIHFYPHLNAIGHFPLFSVFAVHLKSRRDRPHDAHSEVYRRAQVYRMADLVRDAYENSQGNTPIFLIGDFNTELNYALPSNVSEEQKHELSPLFDLGFRNSLDLLSKTTKPMDRSTHVHFDRKGRPKFHQLDGFLMLENQRDILLESGVQDFVDSHGEVIPPAHTPEERAQDPSDHRLIYMDFDIEKVLRK